MIMLFLNWWYVNAGTDYIHEHDYYYLISSLQLIIDVYLAIGSKGGQEVQIVLKRSTNG